MVHILSTVQTENTYKSGMLLQLNSLRLGVWCKQNLICCASSSLICGQLCHGALRCDQQLFGRTSQFLSGRLRSVNGFTVETNVACRPLLPMRSQHCSAGCFHDQNDRWQCSICLWPKSRVWNNKQYAAARFWRLLDHNLLEKKPPELEPESAC